jgi:hypothetical protein
MPIYRSMCPARLQLSAELTDKGFQLHRVDSARIFRDIEEPASLVR